MKRPAAFALMAGTVVLAETVGHQLGAQAWLVIPLTILAAAAGAGAVDLGRQHERKLSQRPTAGGASREREIA